MGNLSFILASMAEASISLSSIDGVTSSPCQQDVKSWIDIVITFIICASIVTGVFLIVRYLKEIVGVKRSIEPESLSQKKTQDVSEIDIFRRSQEKERLETAWRVFNLCWRVEHPDPKDVTDEQQKKEKSGLTDVDKQRYQEAWNFIRNFMGASEYPCGKDQITK